MQGKRFAWNEFRRQFVVYAVLVTALGLARILIGQISVDSPKDFAEAFLAWELVYLPLAALTALYAATRLPEPAIPRKPRIVKSIIIGFAIPAVGIALAWALFR